MAAKEVSANSSSSTEVFERNLGNSVAEMLPNDGEHRSLESQSLFSNKFVKDVLEKSASTGEFWQDWEKLKSILSYYLKQVLSQYPEAKMTAEQQISSLGEAFSDLVARLDDALYTFDEGPPFTLQRLCEILLSARSIYPQLSKLAFALEKNLLVTSTLNVSTQPKTLLTERNSNGSYEQSPLHHTNSVENGVTDPSGDGDVIMAEVHDAEVHEDMTIDMEPIDSVVGSTETNVPPKVES